MSRSVNIDKINIGDIILTGMNTTQSRVISSLTYGKYSHALIYCGNGYAYESTKNGVRRINVSSDVFEADRIKVLRLRNYITASRLDVIVDYLASQSGCLYSSIEAGMSQNILSKLSDKYRITSGQFCSRLVCRAFDEAKLRIADKVEFSNPNMLHNKYTEVIENATINSPGKIEPDPIIHIVERNHEILIDLIHHIGMERPSLGQISLEELPSLCAKPRVSDLVKAFLLDRCGHIETTPKSFGHFYAKLQALDQDISKIYCIRVAQGYHSDLRYYHLLLRRLKNRSSENPESNEISTIMQVVSDLMQKVHQRNLEVHHFCLTNNYDWLDHIFDDNAGDQYFEHLSHKLGLEGLHLVYGCNPFDKITNLLEKSAQDNSFDLALKESLNKILNDGDKVYISGYHISVAPLWKLNCFIKETSALITISEHHKSESLWYLMERISDMMVQSACMFVDYVDECQKKPKDLDTEDERDHLRRNYGDVRRIFTGF